MILIWNTISVRIGSLYYYYVNDLLNVNCEIMSNAGNELNDDFYVEETDIYWLLHCLNLKKEKQVSICVYYIFVTQYKLMLLQ